MLMAEAGNTDLVITMLKRGADPDLQDYHGLTALHAAIKSRVDQCVDALLDHPCNLNLHTLDGRSVLHTACLWGNFHAAKRIVELAPQLVRERHSDERTPLEDVEFLLEDPLQLKSLQRHLTHHNFRCSSKHELQEAHAMLENAPLN